MSSAAIILHGAGSTSDFVERAFPADRLGVDVVVAPADRTGSLEAMAGLIDQQCEALAKQGLSVEVVGGVSIGSHAAMLWASRLEADEPWSATTLLLALPAWLGAPDHVAAMTTASADQIRRQGISATLAGIRRELEDPEDWVLAELERAWTTYSDAELAHALEAVGRARTPDLAEAARIALNCVVVGMAEDPLHPLCVAESLASAIPRTSLRVVDRAMVGQDVTRLSGWPLTASAAGAFPG